MKLAFLLGMRFLLHGERNGPARPSGRAGHAPENTLPSFQRAVSIGVDTLELDVGVTRDGVVVIHHDRRLNPDVARRHGRG